MRVAVWPADDGGCGHYRCIWPARALADQGADIDLRDPAEGSGLDGVFVEQDGITRLLSLAGRPDFDLVVLQRPLAAWRADLVPLLQAKGVRVVVEIDDDFTTLHPGNISWRSTHPKHSPQWNRDHLTRACRQADLVTVTTRHLAHRYGAHGRVAIIPNHIPARYLTIDGGMDGEQLTIGWTGSLDTHPTDLQVTRGAIARTATELGARVAVVGTGKGVRHALGLDDEPLAAGWVPLEQYPEYMAQAHIGIVPLDDIAFNHAKSWLKMAEYAALGVPVIASPTADNAALHARGVGVLAGKPKHWATQLRRLASPDARAELAAAGRDVMAGLTIEGNTDRWWDAWRACLDQRSAA